MKQNKYLFSLIIFLAVPASAAAQASEVVFTTPPQTVGVGIPSATFTLGVQDANGNPVSGGIPQTGCIALTTSSQTGQFSSSATNWNPVGVLTMNKGTSNRSFFYQDSTAGTYAVNVTFALKPTTVTGSCASWSQSEWGTVFHATQNVSIGSGTSDTISSDSTTSDQTTSLTPATTQQTVSSPTVSGGSEVLTVKITSQPVAVVGAGSFFSGSASDSRGLKGSNTRYIWNFGDGATEDGQTVFHAYTYPGTYTVLMTAASGNETGIGRASVQVVAAQIALLAEPDGSVVISNQSSQELNIGLWNISSGTSTFPIPQDTILLGRQSIHFSSEVMHMVAAADVTLRYPNNTVVPVTMPAQKPNPSVLGAAKPAQARPIGLPAGQAGSSEPRPDLAPASAESSATQASRPRSASADSRGLPQEPQGIQGSSSLLAAAETPVWSFKFLLPFLPYVLGALGLILVGVGLFFRKNPMKQVTNSVPDEFDIEG